MVTICPSWYPVREKERTASFLAAESFHCRLLAMRVRSSFEPAKTGAAHPSYLPSSAFYAGRSCFLTVPLAIAADKFVEAHVPLFRRRRAPAHRSPAHESKVSQAENQGAPQDPLLVGMLRVCSLMMTPAEQVRSSGRSSTHNLHGRGWSSCKHPPSSCECAGSCEGSSMGPASCEGSFFEGAPMDGSTSSPKSAP